MKFVIKLFLILMIFFNGYNIYAQYKTNLKTNVLSLLITTPQLSLEQQLTEKSSLTLSGYKGKFTFISETRIQGANLLYRHYSKTGLRGFYPEFGFSIHSNYINNKFDYEYGPRVGIGYQFGNGRWAFDLGIGLGFYIDKLNEHDPNLMVNTYVLEPNLRLNTSIGIRF